MQDSIQDIFSEFEEPDDKSLIFDEQLQSTYIKSTNSVSNHISSLSEIFLEWYLFDSSTEKDVQKFLTDEDLTDIFKESDFMDLMCGTAYLDEELIKLVLLKLPFHISTNKLQYLNFYTSYLNPNARLIKSTDKTIAKMNTLSKLKLQEKKDKEKQRDKKYYETHKEINKQKKHEYYLKNREKIQEANKLWIINNLEKHLAYQKQYRLEHLEESREYHKQYRKNNAEVVSERKKKCYNAKKEQYLQHHHEYYETNKDKLLAQNKIYYKAKKQRAKKALTVCAAYVLLSKLKKKNKDKYLKLYSEQQDPLNQMIPNCIALQTMNLDLCPWLNENYGISIEQCCNQNVLALPRVKKRLPKMAQMLVRKRETKKRNDIYYQQWHAAHRQEKREYDKQYRQDNAAAVSERKKKCYHAKIEQYKLRNKQNYEKNKEQRLAQQRQHLEELKRKEEQATTLCAAYIFLLNLRKTNYKQYLQLYTRQQRPLTGMLKTCLALRNMDINMCPLFNKNSTTTLNQNCNEKVLSMPGAIEKMKIIASNLNQK